MANLENYVPVPESGCWLWLGAVDRYGYGKSHGTDGWKPVPRLFYIAHVGQIPYGAQVCHKCDTPLCVNPSHLFLGTARDNAVDRERKRRGRWAGRAVKQKEAA